MVNRVDMHATHNLGGACQHLILNNFWAVTEPFLAVHFCKRAALVLVVGQ